MHTFAIGIRVVPITVLVGLWVWSAYTLAFFLAFRTLDLLEQLPPDAYVLAFGWGGLGAVYFAAPANVAIQSLCAKLVSPAFAALWGAAIAGPFTEEFLKLAGVMLLILVARNQFRNYLSVLIVGATAGLGFQVVENLSDTVSAAMVYPLENQLYPVLVNLLTRGLMSGLWSHAAYTTVASFGLAWFMFHKEKSRVARLAVAVSCFAMAWAMHFVWNSPWLENVLNDGYGEMAALLAIKGIPAMVAVALFWHVAAREDGAQLHALAAVLVPERELIGDDEWFMLGAPMLRWKARRAIGNTFGARARRLMSRLQREQLRLVRKAAMYGRGAQTLRHETEVRQLRAALDSLVKSAN
ncbi:PrsW family intramembrane metalloprotease [soil metagenome]